MDERRNCGRKWRYPLLLTLLFLLATGLSVPEGYLYGSTTDWFSQHAALAETIRNACLEQKTLLPEYLELGGGSNGFLFSYYGYLRPDLVLGCLLPGVPMLYILTLYMLAGYLASVLLFYRLLLADGADEFMAFWGSVLFLFSACFFQTHRQVMFVNYMPFLLGALLMVRGKKYGRVCVLLSLVYCNSFYYAIAVLFAVGWYWYREEGKCFLTGYIKTAAVSIGMAAALLIPTGLAILEHRRAGAGPEGIFRIQGDFSSVLYSPYGMGLTVVCLYALFWGLRIRSLRADSVCYLFLSGFGLASYLLNGTLYARSKILMPFVPLVLLHCVRVFRRIVREMGQGCLWPFVPLGVVAVCYVGRERSVWIAADLLVLGVALLLLKAGRVSPAKNVRRAAAFLLLLVLPASFFLKTAETDGYVEGKVAEEIALETENSGNGWTTPVYAGERKAQTGSLASAAARQDETEQALYRFDSIYEPLATGNRDASAGRKKSTMYSSVTDDAYREIYYDRLMTPVQINNRIAILAADNPFLFYFLGVRRLETEPGRVPDGYEVVEERGNRVIAENKKVLPIAYLTADGMAESEYKKLDAYGQLDALMQTTIIGDEEASSDREEASSAGEEASGRRGAVSGKKDVGGINAAGAASEPRMKACEIAFLPCRLPAGLAVRKKGAGVYEITAKEKCSLVLELTEPVKEHILLLSFAVKNKEKNAVVIDINRIRNKLSGKNAPYPNKNEVFHYQFSEPGEDGVTRLSVTFSRGKYEISEIAWHTYAKELLGRKDITEVAPEPLAGSEVFSCTAEAKEDGYFVTSIPRQRGMKLWIDGKRAPLLTVNEAFCGARIAAGRHAVTITFTPPGLRAGYVVSAVSILLFLSGVVLRQGRRRLP